MDTRLNVVKRRLVSVDFGAVSLEDSWGGAGLLHTRDRDEAEASVECTWNFHTLNRAPQAHPEAPRTPHPTRGLSWRLPHIGMTHYAVPSALCRLGIRAGEFKLLIIAGSLW